jgi:hypothetical protein
MRARVAAQALTVFIAMFYLYRANVKKQPKELP